MGLKMYQAKSAENKVRWLRGGGGGLLRIARNTFGLEFLKFDEFFCNWKSVISGHKQTDTIVTR